jgi:hypothetical protein
MPIPELTGLLILGLLGWFWYDSLSARDAAVRAARAACVAEGLLLLDDTVAIAGIRPARNDDGELRLCRSYAFEFSDTGDNRRRGSIVLLGREVSIINVGPRLVG